MDLNNTGQKFEGFNITSNDPHSAVQYTYTIHYAILFINRSTMLDSLIGKPYLTIFAEEVLRYRSN